MATARKLSEVILLTTLTLADEETLQTRGETQRAHKRITEQTTRLSRNPSLLNDET